MESKKTTTPQPKSLIVKLAVHIAIILILGIVGAIGAHFALVGLTRHNARCTVPDGEGRRITEAQSLAQKSELNIIITDSLYAPMYEGGMVLDQLPKAGVGVKPGRTIYVTINAFGDKMSTIPYVAGRSLRQAKNMLEVAGFQIEKLIYKQDMAANYVLAQYCNNQEILEQTKLEAVVGSGVTLHVGMSEEVWSTSMPQLVGLSLAQAKSAIWESGLNVGKITMPKDATAFNKDRARVITQSKYAGTKVTFGTNISVELSLDEDKIKAANKEAEKMEAKIVLERSREADSLAKVKISNAAAAAASTPKSTPAPTPTVAPKPTTPTPVEAPKPVAVESDDSFFE